MSKTITKRLMYVVAVLALLAMMIPMAIPVSAAAGDHLVMTMAGLPDGGYNVADSTVTIMAVAANGTTPVTNVDHWNLVDQVVTTNSHILTTSADNSTITVIGVWGETQITATLTDGSIIYATGTTPIDKKWGQIESTMLLPASGSSYITWNEQGKSWFGTQTFTDNVVGDFVNKDGVHTAHPAQGAILNWFLIDGYQTITMWTGENPALRNYVAGLTPARFATFSNSTTMIQTVSGIDGSSPVVVTTDGEEAFKVVVVAEYPGDPQLPTTIEVASWNFKTREMEVVPQVRWAGEKIVLEKNFGTVFHNESVGVNPLYLVRFATTTDNAILEATGNTFIPLGGGNFSNTPQSVWTTVDDAGFASVVLYDANEGQVDVVATLYELVQGNDQNMAIINQHAFTVFYLKFESVTLGNVVGKRDGHNTGLWTPENPVWDIGLNGLTPSPDDLAQQLNVSQDALLRARVKGWFTNANLTTRPAGTVDVGGIYPLALPLGRYVLPDDWASLAGPVNWTERRIHWDIMSAPNDGKTYSALNPLGNYRIGTKVVATADVIGPFSPGIEVMTDTGWLTPNPRLDMDRQMQTVVPNGNLDWWDAPMPPAKIIFEINAGPGYFKTALKTDIYYVMILGVKNYTNPFYQEMIPAHEAIPPFDNNGGYDWASFGMPGSVTGNVYGPYPFWQIINQPDGIVAAPDATHPTKVEVYSDNHGEGMVWLNGNSNLHLTGTNGGNNVSFGAILGTTVAQATADYPYFRVHQAVYSNTVAKTWTWGGQVLGPDNQTGQPMVLVAGNNNGASPDVITLDPGFTFPLDPILEANASGTSQKHVVWVWATDRDGMQAGVLGTEVDWSISGASTVFYNGAPFTGINSLAPNSTALQFDGNGFLLNTAHPGMRAAGANITTGMSWLRAPTTAEANIFYKFYNNTRDPNGLQPSDFAVAAIDVVSGTSGVVNVVETLTGPDFGYDGSSIGTIRRQTDFNTAISYPLDDTWMAGDANRDGVVNPQDIIAVERIVLGMDQTLYAQADANNSQYVNMGDVIRIEKIYLGLPY